MRVLVVDDDPAFAPAVRRMLGRGHTVDAATTLAATLHRLVESGAVYGAVLADLNLGDPAPELDGRWVLRYVAAHWPATRRVLVSGGRCGPIAAAHAVVSKVELTPAVLRAALGLP